MEADSRESEHGEPPRIHATSAESPGPVGEQPALLRLPLELREMIYQHLLLVGVISFGPVLLGRTRPYNPSYSRECKRSIFKTECATYEGTYGLVRTQNSDLPFLAILGTCKEIYRESARYFYSKNTFLFDMEFNQYCGQRELNSSIKTALAFLEDRPSCVLGWIGHIKILLGADRFLDNEISHEFLHQCAPLGEVNRFYKFVQERTKLKQLSILIRGWPPDVRPGILGFDYRPEFNVNRRQRHVGPWTSKNATIGLKHLLSLCNIPRLSVEIHAKQASDHGTLQAGSFDPGRLVAFAALLRSRLLKNGEALGAANISVHKRHSATVAFPVGMPNISACQRHRGRVWVVRSDDNHLGKSLLAPVERLPRLLVRDPNQSEQLRKLFYKWDREAHKHLVVELDYDYPFGPPRFVEVYGAMSPFEFDDIFTDYDYNNNDDGETDSLKDVELKAEDVEHIPPEVFM